MSIRILLVDDSPAMRSFMRRAILMSGIAVQVFYEAGNGLEALDCLAVEQVDVVLCDVNMPKMDGEEFLERMGQLPLSREIPVIIVSTDATTTRVKRVLELGARDYVRKPFTPEALRNAIEKALEPIHA